MEIIIILNTFLELHDVSAGGRADEARADVSLLGVQLAHVSRVLVVIDNLKIIRGTVYS